MHRLRNMACVRGIGPYQLGLRRDRGVRLVAPTAQRLRRDPRSLATCSIALVSDEYEPRDSVNSLTAFASNSGVYLVPFAMVPSSPIELGEMRNKNQLISGVFLDLVREKIGECTAFFIKKDTVRICILKRLTDHSVCALFIGMIESSELRFSQSKGN